MNSINSGFTASSILKGIETKVKPEEESVTVETKDSVAKSEYNNLDFKKISLPKLSENVKSGILSGALIGGGVGALAGGITAYNMAWSEIKATVPLQSIDLSWQEPDLVRENIGSIPSDYYNNSSSYWASLPRGGVSNTPVYENQPILVDGKPKMHEINKTYTDYGTPAVEWKSNNINEKTLMGYRERVVEDYHYEQVFDHYTTVSDGTDSDGNTIYRQEAVYRDVKVTDGYWHKFSPDIEYTKWGQYETPSVKFDHGGIDVGLRTLAGIGIGAGIGALAGAVAGGAIAYARGEKDNV